MYKAFVLLIGVIYSIKAAHRLSRFVYAHFIHKSALPRYLRAQSVSSQSSTKEANGRTWALITGSSSGLGLNLAHQLASKGFNILLHGRNSTKLGGVQDALQKAYPNVHVRMLIIDAFSFTADDIVAAADTVQKLPGPLTLLINNIGYAETFYSFAKEPAKYLDDMINANFRFTIQLTAALMPQLQRNSPSAIMNMSSFVSDIGSPFQVDYCAAKAGVVGMTKALARESRFLATGAGHDGRDKSQLPGVVEVKGFSLGGISDTPMWDKKYESLEVPLASTMAAACLQKLGLPDDIVTPWWFQDISFGMMGMMPEWMFLKGWKGAVSQLRIWEQRVL